MQHRLGVGLVALGVVGADDDVEELAERDVLERELDRPRRFAVTIPSVRPSSLQLHEHRVHAGARQQRVVERLVVRAVDRDELVDPVGIELAHLVLEARAADRRPSAPRRGVAAEHGHRRVPHRGDDDRAGVDHGAVEIEEDDWEAHGS